MYRSPHSSLMVWEADQEGALDRVKDRIYTQQGRCMKRGLFGMLKVVGDPGIEPGVRLREGVTVPCHTLRPVAH